ncbi:MAG: malate dehydrogenase [Nitrosopumilus sp.]|nr:malate dehydrogenase [Nitrosopumilus sp.]CAI9832743.1 Malate dehydrogenase [Nitrosopumilaceae archaeon]MDA7945398.1 malate dehydrogenase [Nitrosopumilus sp.]MDA7953064.1 malate dehydrogenase [Nitrosopumilus sp.]MDA7955078.1 malate dehydrogenase [Nitrosopumilus sp.]
MITIIGSGKVGGDAALFTALRRLDGEVLLLDVAEGLPQGEAMDINHMLAEQGIDVEVRGSNDPAEMAGSQVVVVVAGAGRKPGMTRMDLLKINSGIVRKIAQDVKRHAPDAVLVPVTNPLDPMVHTAYLESGFERSRVLGMGGMLDLSRFRQLICAATGRSRESVRALVIGEHGENMLPLARFASVSGIPLLDMLPAGEAARIVEETRGVAAKVIGLKGATVHAPGNAISAMIEAVVRDRNQVIPASTPLDGEYGQRDVSIGVPVVAGRGGVRKIIELDLDADERAVFERGADGVRAALAGI